MIKSKQIEQLGKASRVLIECECEQCGNNYTEPYRNLTRSQFAEKYCRKCRVEVKRLHLSQLKTEFYQSVEGEKAKQHLSTVTRRQAKNKQGAFTPESRKKQAKKLAQLHKDPTSKYAQHVFKVTRGEQHPNWKGYTDKFQAYKAKVYAETGKWDLSNLPNFKQRGRCGEEGAVQLDHKISIAYGFKQQIAAEIIGHICNLEFLTWEQNRQKGTKNTITLAQLLTKIEAYNEKSSTTIPSGSRVQANPK